MIQTITIKKRGGILARHERKKKKGGEGKRRRKKRSRGEQERSWEVIIATSSQKRSRLASIGREKKARKVRRRIFFRKRKVHRGRERGRKIRSSFGCTGRRGGERASWRPGSDLHWGSCSKEEKTFLPYSYSEKKGRKAIASSEGERTIALSLSMEEGKKKGVDQVQADDVSISLIEKEGKIAKCTMLQEKVAVGRQRRGKTSRGA